MEEQIDEPILIRYDGMDAAGHEIEMASLAKSLQGIARIISVAGNFAATHQFVQHQDAMAIKVVVRPPEAHCYEMVALLKWGAQHPLIATTVGGLAVTLITYIFKRAAGQREEMKHLQASLETAIRELGSRDSAVVSRLLDTVDRMADSLAPSVRLAVDPIGKTASTLSVGSLDRTRETNIGAAEKEAILQRAPAEIDQERTYHILITSLDVEGGTCRLSLINDPDAPRISGRITDPMVLMPDNKYALSMAAHRPIVVRAKASLRDGIIEKLFISDVASE